MIYCKPPTLSFISRGLSIGRPCISLSFLGSNSDPTTALPSQNSLSIREIASQLTSLYNPTCEEVSLGGGEPLLQVDALQTLATHLKKPLHLYTNGTLTNQLIETRTLFTTITIIYTPHFDDELTATLSSLIGQKNIVMIYPLERQFNRLEYTKLVSLLSTLIPDIPFIIEPIIPFSGNKNTAKSEDIMGAYSLAKSKLKDIYIRPNTDTFINL